MLKDITRDDLTELYRIIMNRYGVNGPEDELEKSTLLNLEASDIYYCYWKKISPLTAKSTMSNKHKDWLVQEQTALGKDFSNPLMADNLPKIVWLSTHHIWKRDTAYQRQVFTRKRVQPIPNTAYSPSAIRHEFYGFMYDTDDDASISGKSCEHFGRDWLEKDSPGTEVDWQDDPLQETEDLFVRLDQSIQVVVVQNNFQLDTNIDLCHSEQRAAGEWFRKDCIGSVTTWEYLVEKIVQKFYQLTDHNEEIEAEEDDDPDDITNIFKIEGNLFDYETPLCKAFNDYKYLLKIDTNLFTFDIQGIGTYEEYELNNPVTRDLEEPWSDNGVPHQLCDHICEYRFKNGINKWPTCSSDIDGFCNSGELPGMVRVRSMTYFQDHKWYDELADGKLKAETLMHKVKVEESQGNVTPECWWKINAHEVAPFTRLESYGQRPYANFKTEKAHDPYLEINNIFGRNYDTSNTDNTQDNQENEERRDDPALEPSVCKIRRFEMMKYSFNADEEYIAIKESEYLNYPEDNLDAYRGLLRIIDEGWVMETPGEE
ncbi:hypothetical protein Tco_0951486 [Tanacetum coccineum]|uniref:Uncharacterized protein n=1 Tax=Tanacetum coccineum TaxID=301880 RepID=A0ABQ5DU95_9ASTR